MKKFNTSVIKYLLTFSVIVFSACSGSESTRQKNIPKENPSSLATKVLVLKSTIKLDDVKGGFDLMALDTTGQRLFLAAEDNHTVEVIDLNHNKLLVSLPGFNEPKWIVYRPESNRLYVSTGGDGKVIVLDATTYKTIKSFSFKQKCNNLRFDSANQQLYVGVGKTIGAIGIIDTKHDKILNEIPLSDFPKQFELDGNRIYVNIPSKNSIELINRSINKVVTTWVITESTGNVPMALDIIHHRLFVACEPGRFIVFNTETGKSIASLSISKNADGIYLDQKHSLIYISCGEGFIEVLKQKDADNYLQVDKIETVKGAGTSLFSSQLNQLFLAVPQTENTVAELRVYNTVK